uniref:Uncharacterized protein n=1 Tax=Oryza punctata TaxID=4537 RepID=A0A0E0LSG3_ORYPU
MLPPPPPPTTSSSCGRGSSGKGLHRSPFAPPSSSSPRFKAFCCLLLRRRRWVGGREGRMLIAADFPGDLTVSRCAFAGFVLSDDAVSV